MSGRLAGLGLEYPPARDSLRVYAAPLSWHESLSVNLLNYNFPHQKNSREFDVPRQLQIDEITLERWLVLIEQNYLATNPYHNSTHAADVLSVSQPRSLQVSYKLNSGYCIFLAN